MCSKTLSEPAPMVRRELVRILLVLLILSILSADWLSAQQPKKLRGDLLVTSADDLAQARLVLANPFDFSVTAGLQWIVDERLEFVSCNVPHEAGSTSALAESPANMPVEVPAGEVVQIECCFRLALSTTSGTVRVLVIYRPGPESAAADEQDYLLLDGKLDVAGANPLASGLESLGFGLFLLPGLVFLLVVRFVEGGWGKLDGVGQLLVAAVVTVVLSGSLVFCGLEPTTIKGLSASTGLAIVGALLVKAQAIVNCFRSKSQARHERKLAQHTQKVLAAWEPALRDCLMEAGNLQAHRWYKLTCDGKEYVGSLHYETQTEYVLFGWFNIETDDPQLEQDIRKALDGADEISQKQLQQWLESKKVDFDPHEGVLGCDQPKPEMRRFPKDSSGKPSRMSPEDAKKKAKELAEKFPFPIRVLPPDSS